MSGTGGIYPGQETEFKGKGGEEARLAGAHALALLHEGADVVVVGEAGIHAHIADAPKLRTSMRYTLDMYSNYQLQSIQHEGMMGVRMPLSFVG